MTTETVGTSTEPQARYEMPKEEYDQKMRAVILGETDKMPDGTPISEIHANIRKMEAEQDAARAQVVKEEDTYEYKAGLAVATKDVSVIVSQTGVSAESTVFTDPKVEAKPTEPENDLPAALPFRSELLSSKIVSFADLKLMTKSDLIALKKLGPAKVDEILAFIA